MPQNPSPTLTRATSVLFALLLLASGVSAAPKYKVLHAFGLGNDGGGLWGSLVLDTRGNVYGSTSGGGVYDYGTVFELTPGLGGEWTESILHSYEFGDPDGDEPNSDLILDAEGNLYGTAGFGGTHNRGTVFELAHGTWAETVLYNFCSKPDCRDGGSPKAGLVRDDEGNFYGTAFYPFELSPKADGWKETVLHRYNCRNHGPCDLLAGLILDAAGNLYGITGSGGAHDYGTVFELTYTPADGWKQTILHSFGTFHTDGRRPYGGALTLDSAGNLYGTTGGGGKHVDTCSCGTVFKLTPGANGKWKETILHSFTLGSGGLGPGAGVVMDKTGNLYGTASAGGNKDCSCGVVFELAPSPDGKWKYTVLHSFVGSDGAGPGANLILDGGGNLYGTTTTGGEYNGGVAFEVTP